MSTRAGRSLVAALASLCTLAVAASASAAAVPNPCTLVPASTVASTVGLAGVTLSGKLSTRADGRVTQSLCTYKHGTTTIEIMVAPHQQIGGSGGGAPGMVRVIPPGLGSHATDFYDTTPRFAFANVSFTKGNIDASAYDSGALPNDDVVALAHLLFRALP